MNEQQSLLDLTYAILEFAEHGDYSNGNEAFGIDEGRVMANNALELYKKQLDEFKEKIDNTLKEIKWKT